MHFGQFNLMGYRTPGTRAQEIYDNAVEQVKAAEANGFEIAWFAEHHFSNYCVCPSPLMMLARLAGETSRIRLGSAVVVAPLYQPVRLISEIGMVDALTHGRLVLGVGSGYQPYEFERFGEELADSVPKLFEFMEMLELAFTRDVFSYQGKHYTLPETHIAPRPANGPPEIWVAGDNPALHALAARKGWTVMLTPRHASVPQLLDARERLAGIYRAEAADPARVAIAPLRHVCITDSKAEAASFMENARHQNPPLAEPALSRGADRRHHAGGEALQGRAADGRVRQTRADRRRRDGGRAHGGPHRRGGPQAHAAALPGRRLAAEDGAAVDRTIRCKGAPDAGEAAGAFARALILDAGSKRSRTSSMYPENSTQLSP